MNQEITQDQIKMYQAALANAKDVVCSCGHAYFGTGLQLKRLSKILTGEQEDTLLKIPAIFCLKCFKLLSDSEIEGK